MNAASGFRLTQGFYWLALGAWFGAVLMMVVSAGITFATVRQYQPTLGLEPYNAPELAEKAAPILAGGVVGRTLRGLAIVQLTCGAIVVFCVIVQCSLFPRRVNGGVMGRRNLLRVALIAGPLLILLADMAVVIPSVWKQRQAMYDLQQTNTVRDAARAKFDRLHKTNEWMVTGAGVMLIAAVFVSSFTLHLEDPQTTDRNNPRP